MLCEKYQIEIKDPVIVEHFPKQEDFAIRTFWLRRGGVPRRLLWARHHRQ